MQVRDLRGRDLPRGRDAARLMRILEARMGCCVLSVLCW
jgi:hypothetical protein